ncbi:unannotated protein [freshwater metagenome]|uniref:Unannotated protein n=1 Tax=freshwater metagenome TaxID=449393 RepID=A0A6J7E4Q4_9ZZZZ|nr:hypothetical protein [Actinomycetota bacterium]
MTISIQHALRHLDWAEQKFFALLEAMPEQYLASHYGNPEWPVAVIAQHIVSGAGWYEFCLTGVFPEEPVVPTSSADFGTLRNDLAKRNAVLHAQADLEDELLTVSYEDDEFTVWRSILLSQAVQHSVEHRAQIACALEANGYQEIDLEELDAWAFARATGL